MTIELFNDAVHWRKFHRKKLIRGNKHQRRVARTLKNCTPSQRCDTEACRVCMREFRISWSGEAVKIFARLPHWTRCSVIPKGLLIPYGGLKKFDLNATAKRLRKSLERSAIKDRIVLGGLDVSLNLENNKIIGWQFHLYLIVEGKKNAALQQAIRAAFPPEPKALVPYDFVEISDPIEAITYAYKAVFGRRSGYKTSHGGHRTKNQPLKGADLRRLLPFLALYKAGARLILRGVRRNGQHLAFAPTKRRLARPK
jgi:hypothetical protein